MSFIKKKKMLKNFKNIQENNKRFIEYLSMLERYPLEERDKKNLEVLKEHLNNMTVLFQGLSESVNKNKPS